MRSLSLSEASLSDLQQVRSLTHRHPCLARFVHKVSALLFQFFLPSHLCTHIAQLAAVLLEIVHT